MDISFDISFDEFYVIFVISSLRQDLTPQWVKVSKLILNTMSKWISGLLRILTEYTFPEHIDYRTGLGC